MTENRLSRNESDFNQLRYYDNYDTIIPLNSDNT